MQFFASAITTLQTLVIALGAGLGVWGVVNLLEGYSKHPEAKKLRSSKAASHVPAWRANQPQEKQTPSAPPSQAADKKPAQKKKPASTEKVVTVTKESIMKKKEDT